MLKTSQNAERRGATDHRRRILNGLAGTALELGAGHGLNFPHYPPTSTEVIAIEPEPTLRAAATAAAADAPVPVRVLAGVADSLPLERRHRRRQPRALLGPRPGSRPRRASPRATPRRRAALPRACHR